MKRYSTLLIVAVAAALVGFVYARGLRSGTPLKTLTLDEVATRIAAHDGHTFVFDNNPKEVFDHGHLPGARWVPFDGVTASVLPADKAATLIFYCASPS